MKKKLLSLFALLCLVLPACIGLVGCGSSKTDSEVITTALDQVANVFIEKGKALNASSTTTSATTSSKRIVVDGEATTEEDSNPYLSFDDFATKIGVGSGVVICAKSARELSWIKGSYSNETLKEAVKDNGPTTISFKIGTAVDADTYIFTFKITIDRASNKITCVRAIRDKNLDLKIEINYDFDKDQVLSFDLFFDGFFIKYENSTLTVATSATKVYNNYTSAQQAKYQELLSEYNNWLKENNNWNANSTQVNDDTLYDYFNTIAEEVDNKIYSTGTTE